MKRILTLGDSWTFGVNSSDPDTMSWPAQLSRNYEVEVVNLARSGACNQRQMRIGIEELCRDSAYDLVIFAAGPANRTEVIDHGKWQQVWPTLWKKTNGNYDKFFLDLWHPWGDFQNHIMLSFYFIHSLQALGIPLHMTGLSLQPNLYSKELHWIMDYRGDNDFNSIGIPLQELNISIKDLDRKLKSLRAIHVQNLKSQPDYLYPVIDNYLKNSDVEQKYNYKYKEFTDHPNDQGYHALSEYFAKKIGL